jgi:SAM-dependent methyltransferase
MWLPARSGGRLLEVGCGAGVLLERMKDRGWEVRGIEPDGRAAALAARAVGEDAIHTGDLADAPFSVESFDAVVLFHVIEHLLEPRDALDRCRRYLVPGGRLVIATPNIHSLGRRWFGPHWLHWDPPRHIQLYSPRSLGRLVEEAGFRIQQILTPSCSAHAIWSGSTLLRDRGSLPAVDTSVAPPTVKLAGLGFWAWEYLQTRLGRGCGEDLVIIAEPVTQSELESEPRSEGVGVSRP